MSAATAKLSDASLAMVPPKLDFGSVSLDAVHQDRTIVVVNRSSDALYLGSLATTGSTLEDSQGSFFSVVDTDCPASPAPLDAAGSCNYTIRFKPLTVGTPAAAAFAVPFGVRAGAFSLTSRFTATGLGAAAAVGTSGLTLQPEAYDVSGTAAGGFSSTMITVTNETRPRQ